MTKVRQGGADQCFMVTCSKATQPLLDVRAMAIVDARGIGEPQYPQIVVEQTSSRSTNAAVGVQAGQLLENFRQLSPAPERFPRIVHSKFFYECTSQLLEPYAPFAGKKVAVIGGGDSGKTIMEFLVREGPMGSMV